MTRSRLVIDSSAKVWAMIKSHSRWFNSRGTVASALMGMRCLCGLIGLINVFVRRLAFADSFGVEVIERGAALGLERNFLASSG